MTRKFEWHTLENRPWEELEAADESTAVPGDKSWLSRLLSRRFALVLALLLLLVFLGSRQILLRAQEANEQIKADVLAAHDFMLQAALDGDAEQLDLILSEEEMQWRHLQRVYLRRRLLFDRGPLNLWLDETTLRRQLAGSSLPWDVVLAPDLQTAELTTTLPYLTQARDGTMESFSLNRVWHFVYDGRQWRLIPPGEDDWGAAESYNGRLITLAYPARDSEISRTMAAAFDDLFRALCDAQPALGCPPAPAIQITFTSDPEALLPLSRPVQGNRFWIFGARLAAGDTFDITLPSPTLVGLPQTPEDEQHLLDGYAGWLLTAYLSRKHPHLTFAQIDGMLADLDLRLPPPVGYRPVLEKPDAPLPAQRALLSCPDGGRPGEGWAYDFSQDEWSPVAGAGCPGCMPDSAPAADLVSPDGRFTFSRAAGTEQLLLTHEQQGVIAQFGGAGGPLWLDESNAVLIMPAADGTGESALLTTLAEVDGRYQARRTPLVSQQALLAAVPENRIIDTLSLQALAPAHADAAQLYVLAANGVHEQFLFRVQMETGDVALVTSWVDNGTNLSALEAAENGRFLTAMRYSTRRSYLTLIDLASGRRRIMELSGRPLSRHAWSADEQWLLVADDRLLRLLAPAAGVDLTVSHTFGDCTAVRWSE